MPPTSNVPRNLLSAQALIRFSVRMLILSAFAAFGTRGFAKALGSLLVLAALYCVSIAAFRREAPLGAALTHYDEAAAYVFIAGLAVWAS